MKAVFNQIKPTGHYSSGMISNGLLFISGQTSTDPETGRPALGGAEAETRMALKRIETVLEAAGCSRNDVVKCNIYTSSLEYKNEIDNAYKEFFGSHKPARCMVPVGPLNRGCILEVEAVAQIHEA